MTLFVVLGLVAVVVGVLVAVALGVRSMRAEGGEDDWDSPVADSGFADPGDHADDHRVQELGNPIRRDFERAGSAGAQRAGSAGAQRAGSAGAPGARRAAGVGTATDPGYGPDFQLAPAARVDAARVDAARVDAARAASRQVTPDEVPDSRVPAKPGRRHSQQKDQPKKRARPPRLRGGDAGKDWNTTNWERVSDEDYWAEMSADKPLASRTAQSAADLRPREPEANKKRDAHTDPNLSQPEPQTATMAMPGIGQSGRYEARADTVRADADPAAESDVATLPVRRSGSSPDTGRMVPAASVSGAYYSAPSYAPPPSGYAPSAYAPSAYTPSGYTPSGDAGQSGYPAPAGYPASSGYPAPSDEYRTPSHGMSQQPVMPVGPGGATAYGTETPGYGIPANPGYVAKSSYDTSPVAGTGVPESSARFYASEPGHSAIPHSAAQLGPYASRSDDSTPYATGACQNTGSTPAPPRSGPPPTPPLGGYATTYADDYPAAPSGGAAGAPPHPAAGPASGYASQPTGGFASGYLSSSALSARQRMPEPDPLAGPGSGNPYGSYVTGPSAGDGVDAASPYGQPRADAPDYDHRSDGRYGNYGGSHR